MARSPLVLVLVVSALLASPVHGDAAFPDTGVHYRMKASLEPGQRRVRGWLQLRMRNNSRVAITEVRFHLYLNAFAHEDTLFMSKSRGKMRFSRFDSGQPGWIKVLSINRGQAVLKQKKLHDGTVLAVPLDEPLPPGEDLSLMMEFESKLPHLYARTGRAGDFFMVAQWYPKLAYLNKDGTWHSPPYHAYEEYFGPFAGYHVELTIPHGWAVGATGARPRIDPVGDDLENQRFQLSAAGVHDFAFAAWPGFQEMESSRSGVKVSLLTVPGRGASERIFSMVGHGLDRLQRWLFPYPYPLLTVVDVPTRGLGAAGMEYPSLFTTWTPRWIPRWVHGVDVLAIHELVHQYFQGMVASNEVAEPWLDEGVTTYVTGLIVDELFGPDRSVVDLGAVRLGHHQQRRLSAMRSGSKPLAVAGAAASFKSSASYGRTVYSRAALLLATVEDLVGREKMLIALGGYARKYAFSHPGSHDLEAALLAWAPAARQPLLQELFKGVLHGRKVLDYSVTCDGGVVEVKRIGELMLPLELTIRKEGGGDEVRQLNGKARTIKVKVSSGVLRGATLGPVRRLGLDPTPTDLSCVGDRSSGSRAAAWQWTALLQPIFQLIGP